jgi:GTP-binding protein
VVFISAINKRGFSEMMRAIKKAYQSSQKKLSTPQINSVLENALISHPPKIIKGHKAKIKVCASRRIESSSNHYSW